MEAGENLGGIGKVEPAVLKRGGTLRRIEGDPHDYLMYPPEMQEGNMGAQKKITPSASDGPTPTAAGQ